jgi:hypothetical protein
MSWLPEKTVLVPTDFSGPSVDAIKTAMELVETAPDVHVLYVLVLCQVDLDGFQ